jgi:hypothetical protein
MLRGLSEVHLTYLRNMGVRATLTLSIVCDGKLWGLIACHHHSPRTPPNQLRDGMRQLSELLAEIASMRIEALSHLEAVRHRLTLDRLLNQFHQALIQDGDIPTCWNNGCPSCCRHSMPYPGCADRYARLRRRTGKAAGLHPPDPRRGRGAAGHANTQSACAHVGRSADSRIAS